MPLNGSTEIYGIMGKPVAHSLSPAMHNRAFQALGLNKVYVPFEVAEPEAALNGFRALGIKGVSVTIPYKETIIPYLDAIDPVAAKIGAVNTLLLDQGHVRGLNTDWLGANRALADLIELKGKTVILLGAGGSARALGFGLLEAGAKVVVVNRTLSRGQALAQALNCEFRALAEMNTLRGDCLINATSAGMQSADTAPLVPASCLPHFSVVMDIVYAPLETALLSQARQAGCQTINGLAMLLYQGAAQFKHWTGLDAPIEVMRQALLEHLHKHGE